MRTKSIITALSMVVALAVAVPAQGAITVGNTNDAGPGSLRQVVADAPPGETIDLPAGTYTLASEIAMKKGVTIVGAGPAQTIVEAGGDFGVLRAGAGLNLQLTLRDFTIRNGHIVDGGQGAAVDFTGERLSLEHMVFSNNLVEDPGGPGEFGGIATGGAVKSNEGIVTISDSTFTNNRASAPGGSGKFGGIALGGAVYVVGEAHVSTSHFAGNVAEAVGGFGPENSEQFGGIAQGAGLYVLQEKVANSSIVASTFSGSSLDASGGFGGFAGIAAGGGVFLELENGNVVMENTTIAGNSARVTGSTGNGPVRGFGIFARLDDDSSVVARGLTLAANEGPASSPSESSGAYFEGNVSITNSIFTGGPGVASCEMESEKSGFGPISAGFNIDGADQCGFHAAGDKVNTNPLLGPLQDNGGPTPTMLPAVNSPAIDQGAAGLVTDQRGVGRSIDFPAIPNAPGGNGSDIGAAELQPSNLLTLGKLKKNKKKGTATLVVNLPQPSAGTLVLMGKGLKKQTKVVTGQASFKLKVATKGGVNKKLRKKGKRKVKIDVTYTPTGNSAATVTRKAKLVKKKKKKHKKKRAK